jgi:hypothetical protein
VTHGEKLVLTHSRLRTVQMFLPLLTITHFLEEFLLIISPSVAAVAQRLPSVARPQHYTLATGAKSAGGDLHRQRND